MHWLRSNTLPATVRGRSPRHPPPRSFLRTKFKCLIYFEGLVRRKQQQWTLCNAEEATRSFHCTNTWNIGHSLGFSRVTFVVVVHLDRLAKILDNLIGLLGGIWTAVKSLAPRSIRLSTFLFVLWISWVMFAFAIVWRLLDCPVKRIM